MGGGLFVRVELRHVDDRFVVEINRFIGLFVASYAHLEVKTHASSFAVCCESHFTWL